MTLQQKLFPDNPRENADSKYTFFWRGPFSQWHLSEIKIAGKTFNCCEQFMMWSKAMLFGDVHSANKILRAQNPKEQKAIGRNITEFNEAVWKSFRGGVVYTANYAKFTQHAKLKSRLLATRGTVLVEASPHDRIWGIGLAEDDPRAKHRKEWRGLNLLGWTLTRVREALIFEDSCL
jgi:hypothetical protein